MSLANYNATVATTEVERKRQQKISKFFLWITLGFVCASIYSRRKAVNAADELIREIDALPPGTVHNIPADVVAVLRKLKTDAETALTLFRNELNALEIPADDIVRLVSRYDQFTLELKRAFYNDFKGSTNKFWREISKKTEYLDNWESLYQMSIKDRLVFDVITNNKRVTAIVRYYNDNTGLREYLEPLSYNQRWNFLDNMGDISPTNFQKFSDDPTLIKKWFRYYDDGVLRADFKAFGEDGMMSIIEELGGLSDDLMKGFKRNPSKLTEYVNLPSASRKFLRDNKHFWLKCNYSYDYINSFKSEITKAVNKYKTNESFTNPLNKTDAIEELRKGKENTKGELVEKPMRIFLNNSISSSEEVIYSVDILFKKANGTPYKPSMYLDIDAIVIDNTINKIKKPYSAKLNPDDTFKNAGSKRYDDAQKLEFFRNLPDEINAAKTYIQNQNKPVWSQLDLSQIHSIEVRYINNQGTSQTMSLSSFKQKLKPTTYNRNDFIEINPTTFGTTREDLIESLYYRIITE